MTETETGPTAGAQEPHPSGPFGAGPAPADEARRPPRRNGTAVTALVDLPEGAVGRPLLPEDRDGESTTIIPRIPADGSWPPPAVAAPPPSARPVPAQPEEQAGGVPAPRPPTVPGAPAPEPGDTLVAQDEPAGDGGGAAHGGRHQRPGGDRGDRPARQRGRTAIADDVVEKVAGFAAEQVDGVFDLGGDVARAAAAIREEMGLNDGSSRRGVHVELSGRTVRIALTLVVQFGHPAMQIAEQVRENVIAAVETMLTLDVAEVNVIIDDVHVED